MFNNSIMVDVETTGTRFDDNAMIQLAAVKFDLENFTVDTNFFCRSLEIPPNRYWSDDTWNWWTSDKQSLLMDILGRAEDPKLVMQAFADWTGPGQPVFWSKPSHFDFSFISSYFKDYGINNPFHYARAMDMRSFMRGVAYPNEMLEPTPEFSGAQHDALNDALYQIKTLFTFMRPQ